MICEIVLFCCTRTFYFSISGNYFTYPTLITLFQLPPPTQCVFAYVSKGYEYKTQQELAQFEDTATAEATADDGMYCSVVLM